MKFPTEKHLRDFEKDRFNYENLSKKILDEILLKMELPNCFGLYGNWGSGKSTILEYIRQHLTAGSKDKYKDITPIYFEAWKYEYSDQNDLLFALLSCIQKVSNLERNKWKQLLIDAAVVTSGVLRKLELADVQETVANFELFEGKVLDEHERWVDKVEGLRMSFEKTISQVLKKQKSSKLLIFVDDLDRCLPENTVKLLEGIKNFLLVQNTLFVLAVDRRIVGEMVEKKYGLHDGYGDEYLMKIIHYYYELPTVTLKDIVDEVFSIHAIKSSERQRAYVTDFLKSEAREPRAAKHLLHQFGVVLSLSEEAKKSIVEDEQDIRVQYLFLASFLLTKYSKLFSSGDPSRLLRSIRESATALWSLQNRTDEYRKAVEAYSLSPEIRNKLENIIQYPITTGREASPNRFIDVEQLSTAISRLRT